MDDECRQHRVPAVPGGRARRVRAGTGRFGCLYGASAAMQDVYRRIEKVAPTTATV